MGLQLLDGSRVFIDLRATGLLKSLAHSPTLVARPARVTVDFAAPDEPVEVDATFAVNAIEAPADISASDREKMLDNMRRDVFDVARFPSVGFQGQFTGSLERGSLTGDLLVKGASRRITIPFAVSTEANALVARGTWEGRLTDLGIKPFKALLGAIKLEDWIALRVEARFERPPT
jgi:polyisoprenoid-binding protein YceI